MGTEFGPANMALHAVGVAVELEMPGAVLTSRAISSPSSCQPSGTPGTTSISPRHTPCDGRSAKPSAAWRKRAARCPALIKRSYSGVKLTWRGKGVGGGGNLVIAEITQINGIGAHVPATVAGQVTGG